MTIDGRVTSSPAKIAVALLSIVVIVQIGIITVLYRERSQMADAMHELVRQLNASTQSLNECTKEADKMSDKLEQQSGVLEQQLETSLQKASEYKTAMENANKLIDDQDTRLRACFGERMREESGCESTFVPFPALRSQRTLFAGAPCRPFGAAP